MISFEGCTGLPLKKMMDLDLCKIKMLICKPLPDEAFTSESRGAATNESGYSGEATPNVTENPDQPPKMKTTKENIGWYS